MKNMKIACHISSLELGGAERQILVLCETLREQGHDVTLLTSRKGDFFIGELERKGITHRQISGGSTVNLVSWSLARYMRESGTQMLVTFMQRPSVKGCVAHMLWPHFILAVSERGTLDRLRLKDKIRYALFKQADCIICNSFAQKEFISNLHSDLAGKTVTIVNAVDTLKFAPAEAAAKPGIAQISKVILVTARLRRQKNFLNLLEAAKLMKTTDFKIVWYGQKNGGNYCRKCMKALEESGLGGKFIVREAITDIAAAYREATLFCLPSFREGTSNSLAEALSSGLPAIVSRVSDNQKYVTNANGSLIEDPSDPAEIAAALDAILAKSPEELAAIGRASRAVALEYFDKSRFDAQYADLIKKLAR